MGGGARPRKKVGERRREGAGASAALQVMTPPRTARPKKLPVVDDFEVLFPEICTLTQDQLTRPVLTGSRKVVWGGCGDFGNTAAELGDGLFAWSFMPSSRLSLLLGSIEYIGWWSRS